ncbi:MAG: rhomboid family intramembrane serine protease [Anaerostipes sp.]|nr:rhomboid family intramembrane serine protease [Anaerostipes sp.]
MIYQWGASSWPLIVEAHQWYRLFTSNYLHFGFDHLFNNMAVLCILGYEVEKKMGSLRYVMLYVGAGFIGSVASVGYYMATNQNVVSVGASGAIFGLVGALLIIVLKNRGRENEFYKRGFIIVIVGTLYHGISSAGIDNAAHVGGLIGGAILALILYREYRGK